MADPVKIDVQWADQPMTSSLRRAELTMDRANWPDTEIRAFLGEVIEERAPKNVATSRRTRFSDWSLPANPSEHGNGRWKASTPVEILL